MKRENFSNIGTILASLLAASCCLGPAVFVIFGTSIGYLSRLSFLTPVSPYFLGGAFLMLSYSFWKLYLKKLDCSCTEDIRSRRIARVTFWTGFAALFLATSFPKIISVLYG